MAIAWRDLVEPDLDEVRVFICADAPLRTADGELDPGQPMHELDVQAALQDIEFPLARDEHVLIGRDANGIVGIAWWADLAGPARVAFLGAAVARRLRGHRVGDRLIEAVHSRMLEEASARGISVVMVRGYVDSKNELSRSLLSRNGYWWAGSVNEHGNQDWWTRLDVPPGSEGDAES